MNDQGKTMAEVLAEHVIIGHGRTGTYACTNTECGWELVYRGRMDGLMLGGIDPVAREFAAHQEDMLSAAGFGLVADTKAEALEEAADDFENNIGVSEFEELSRRDGAYWNHVGESWQHQGPYMDWLRNRSAALRATS